MNHIINISYSNLFRIVLFKCDWANTNITRMKRDQFKYAFMNFACLIHIGDKLEHDPFILFSQLEPTFYIENLKSIK